MKLECKVVEITTNGDTMTVGLRGRQPGDADWRRDAHQEIEFTCSEKSKRAFWLGRKVTVTVEPR